MAKLSDLTPIPKRGQHIFYYPGDFATFAAFFSFLDNNTYTPDADVILEIANGSVISETILLNGYYPFLTIRVAAGGTAYVDSTTIPVQQPFPSLPSIQFRTLFYNDFLYAYYTGQAVPQYGLKGVFGTFEKTGTNGMSFIFCGGFHSDLTFGVEDGGLGGRDNHLTLVNFDQFGPVQGQGITVDGYIRLSQTKVPDPQPVVWLNSYFSFQSLATNITIEPSGTFTLHNQSPIFLNIMSYIGSYRIQTGATPFNIVCDRVANVNMPTNASPASLAYTVKTGSGGNINNCSITHSEYAYYVGMGDFRLTSSCPLVAQFATPVFDTPLIASVYKGASFRYWDTYDGTTGCSQTLTINFDASLNTNGKSQLFNQYRGSTVTYPTFLTLQAGLSGSNIDKVSMGRIVYNSVSEFMSQSSLINYYNLVTTNQLSVYQSLSSTSGSRIFVRDSDPDSQESYGMTIELNPADLLSGLYIGNILTRPWDALGSGDFTLPTSGTDVMFNGGGLGGGFGIDPSMYAPGRCRVRKTGASGAVVDLSSALRQGSPASIQTLYLTNFSRTYFLYGPAQQTEYDIANKVYFWDLDISGTTLSVDFPFERVTLTSAASSSSVVMLFNSGLRPGDSIRVVNGHSTNVYSGTFQVTSVFPNISIPFTLNPGEHKDVLISWDFVGDKKTLIVL